MNESKIGLAIEIINEAKLINGEFVYRNMKLNQWKTRQNYNVCIVLEAMNKNKHLSKSDLLGILRHQL